MAGEVCTVPTPDPNGVYAYDDDLDCIKTCNGGFPPDPTSNLCSQLCVPTSPTPNAGQDYLVNDDGECKPTECLHGYRLLSDGTCESRACNYDKVVSNAKEYLLDEDDECQPICNSGFTLLPAMGTTPARCVNF